MKQFLRLWFTILFVGCASLTAWQQNPNTAVALQSVVKGVGDYISGNQAAATVDGIAAAAGFLRSLQGTPKAANASAVQNAVTSAGAPPAVAQIVSTGIAQAVSNGAAPSAANESAALALDKATAKFFT